MDSPATPASAPTSTRDRLLEAATKVFLAQGFTAASMDMVRQEAGVSNGSLTTTSRPRRCWPMRCMPTCCATSTRR